MDFAFVPNDVADPPTKAANRFLNGRLPAAQRVPRRTTNLQDILEWIDVKAPAGATIGTVYINSHASATHVSFKFTPGQSDPSLYELLVNIQGPAGPFRVPARFTNPPAAGVAPIRIFIKGCQIGESEAYLRLLKTLLGAQVAVAAPRHFNGFFHIRRKKSSVVFDSLSYNREIRRKAPIADFAKLVEAFEDTEFHRYDGSPQPPEELTALLDQLQEPPKPALDDILLKGTTSRFERHLLTKIRFNESIGGRATHAIKGLAEYWAQRVRSTVARMDMTAFSAKPIADHVIDAEAKWDAKYRSPAVSSGTITKTFGEHLGLAADEAIDEHVEWTAEEEIDRATATRGRKIVGTHYRYRLIHPVTSVADGTLLFDSHREKGPALTSPTTWPTLQTHVDALFREV